MLTVPHFHPSSNIAKLQNANCSVTGTVPIGILTNAPAAASAANSAINAINFVRLKAVSFMATL